MRSEISRFIVAISIVGLLCGCAATQVAVSKRNLEVQTKVSDSIFVREVNRDERTIYVKLRSLVADFPKREFKQVLKQTMEDSDESYVVTDNAEDATYQLNIMIRNLEKASPTAAEAAVKTGYVPEVATGALVGAMSSDNAMQGAAAGGLIAGGASFLANSFVKDVTYMLVTDILITHKLREGTFGRKDIKVDLKQGSTGTSSQRVSEVTDALEQTTRVVTTANKVNLKLDDAKSEMFRKHSYAISGFF